MLRFDWAAIKEDQTQVKCVVRTRSEFGARVPGGARAAGPSLLWWHCCDAVQRYPNTSRVPRRARARGDGQVSISLTKVSSKVRLRFAEDRGHLAAGGNVLERVKQLERKRKSHSETVYT